MIYGCNNELLKKEKVTSFTNVIKTDFYYYPESEDNHYTKERIDGPANVRSSSNGRILFTLSNNVEVECSKLKDDWFKISILLNLSKQQKEVGFLKKGTRIFEDDILVFEAIEDVEIIMTSENGNLISGMIEGFTYHKNIQEESIVENQLEIILNSNDFITINHFKNHFKYFKYNKDDVIVENYDILEQYYLMESWIEDPSPKDRIRLLFSSNALASIIYSRELKKVGYKSYSLDNGMNILILKDFKRKEYLEFYINKYKKHYSLLD